MKRMLFNATHPEETRVGIVDGQKLIDIDIETAGREARKSNIYKGIVTRIEPSLEACFINYGEDRHGFLPFKEISRAYFKPGLDVRTATIREAITEGQELIVQVEKEERGNKGAALTTFISLAGRYLVLMPNNPRAGGVSRRIEGEERQELREAMEKLDVPSGMSTIARTAGIGRTTEELQWDLNYLLKLWEAIVDAAKPQYELVTEENGRRKVNVTTEAVMNGKPLKRLNPAPFLIVEESNLVVRAIRDYFQPEIGEILVDTDEIYEQARQFMAHVMPDMIGRVKRYRDDIPLFTRFQIEQQIETAYSRTVPLPSGGAIVIDHTEALVAIDVNSARATRGADIEETAFRTNCEAADEVARQMRLRDLGGLIVIDFIDMADPKNQRAVEQRLKDAIRFDRARVQIAKISRFGLMELSRQRLRPALSEGSHITCPRCNGVGVIRDTESCAIQVLRILQEEAMKEGTGAVEAQVPVDVATFLLNEKRIDITKLEARHRVPIILVPNTYLETPHYHIERIRQDDERLEKHVASFNLVEEIDTRASDPYAQKSAEEKAPRSKQEPVIKNIMIEREPAPVHVPKEEKAQSQKKPVEARPEAVTPKKGLFARIAAFLFGDKEEKKEIEPETPKKPAEEKSARASSERGSRRGTRRGERTNRSRRDRTGERLERADRREAAAAEEKRADEEKRQSARADRTDRAADVKAEIKADAQERTEKNERRSRRRRSRTEAAADETQQSAQAVQVAPVEQLAPTAEAVTEAIQTTTEPAQGTEDAELAPQETRSEESTERKPRRRSRRRRSNEAVETVEATEATETIETTEAVTAAEVPAQKLEAAEKVEAIEAPVAAESSEGREGAESIETTQSVEGAEAAENAEEGARRRRPRRRRRSRNTAEGEASAETAQDVQPNAVAETSEPAAAAAAAEAPSSVEVVKTEALEQIETKAPEAKTEEMAQEKAEKTVDAKVEPAIDPVEAMRAEVAAHPAFGTFHESEPLVQIETKPSAVSMAVSMAVRETFREAAKEPAKKERRRRSRKPRSEAPVEEKLVQIETKVTADETAAAPATETVQEVRAAEPKPEATETVESVENAQAADAESVAEVLEQIETKPVAAEAVEAAQPVEPLEAVQPFGTLAIAEGLEANLARAGLVQVHTRRDFDTRVSYAPVIYPGRPTVHAATPADEAEGLVQVHTRPELVKPVVYEPVRYPGRRTEKSVEAVAEALVQVETKKA